MDKACSQNGQVSCIVAAADLPWGLMRTGRAANH